MMVPGHPNLAVSGSSSSSALAPPGLHQNYNGNVFSIDMSRSTRATSTDTSSAASSAGGDSSIIASGVSMPPISVGYNINSSTRYDNKLKKNVGRRQIINYGKTNDKSNGSPIGGQQPRVASKGREHGIPPRPTRESVLQRLSEALMRRSLTMIDLSQRGLRPMDAKLVKLALLQNASLSVLKLGYNDLGNEGIITLASGVAAHRTLQFLDVGFNNIGDAGVRALVSAFSPNDQNGVHNGLLTPSLHTLYLAGNSIGESGALALASGIREGCCLTRLHLTGNKIGTNGVKAITEAIVECEMKISRQNQNERGQPARNMGFGSQCSKFSKPMESGMQELFLGGTGMMPHGCHSVSRMLEVSTSLRIISLADSSIGDMEAKVLSQGIRKNRHRLPLESLKLSFNQLTCAGVEALVSALWEVEPFRELQLDNNSISDQGAQIVATALTSRGIEVLDLGFNPITPNGVKVLMKAVSESQRISSLSISGISLDTGIAKAVAYALVHNNTLKSFFLDHCSVGHAAQRHITAGIVSNSRTALHTVTGFQIGAIAVTLGLPRALEKWTNEQVLKFLHLMWERMRHEQEKSSKERELDPLHYLPQIPGEENKRTNGHISLRRPLDPSTVIAVAKRAFESLGDSEEEGNLLRSRMCNSSPEPPFQSPLAEDAIMLEANNEYNGAQDTKSTEVEVDDVTPMDVGESSEYEKYNGQNHEKSYNPDPGPPFPTPSHVESSGARKRRNVDWLCHHIRNLNELSQVPFNTSELWLLHQHFFSPIKNASGDVLCALPEMRDSNSPEDDEQFDGDYSLPRVSPGDSVASDPCHNGSVTAQLSEEHIIGPVSDTAMQGIRMLPMLSRKVSYRSLNDALAISDQRTRSLKGKGRTVSSMIEEGMHGNTLQPRSKRARRYKTRIAYFPRIKAKLDSYLETCHHKALILMKQLQYIERSFLADKDPSANSSFNHLSGSLAQDAETILIDMM